MKYIIKYLSLYIEYSKIIFARGTEFKTDFVLGICINLISTLFTPLFQFLIYHNTRGYPGWTFDEIILFQSILLFWNGIILTLFGSIRYRITPMIIYGHFELFLLKPYPALLLIFAGGFNYYSIGTILAGIILSIYALIKLNLIIGFIQILLFWTFFFIGILFYLSIMIFFLCISFILIYIFNLFEIKDRLISLAHFPAEIYSGLFKTIYLIFFPLAIWTYYPSQTFLGKLNIISIYACISSILMFILSLIAWNFTIKKYTGAGG